jgi:hypothetical protein
MGPITFSIQAKQLLIHIDITTCIKSIVCKHDVNMYQNNILNKKVSFLPLICLLNKMSMINPH